MTYEVVVKKMDGTVLESYFVSKDEFYSIQDRYKGSNYLAEGWLSRSEEKAGITFTTDYKENADQKANL